jgi:phosphoglycolate phosphatase
MVRLVLFDIDGTLIHSGGAGVKAFGRAFATEFGFPDGTGRLKFAGRTDTGLARELFLQHGVPPTPDNFRRFFDAYVHWLDYLLGQSESGTQPGVWEFIRDLRTLPEPPAIGLLTGNIRLGAEIKLRHFELWELFQTGAFADDHEDRDQIAAIARERGGRLLNAELKGDQILVVGDTPRDIRCARAIHARMLAVATGGASLEELAVHHPDWLVEDLHKITTQEVCR